MDNKTKILIGIGLAGIAYFLWKKSPKSTASVDLPVEKIDEQLKKELPKDETPITPSKPVIPTPSEKIVIPDMPPIVIDFSNLAPNIGSSLVNTNVIQQQKCLTVEEWLKMKENDTLPPINSYCVESGGLIITDKQRLENAFQMKDFKNELSRDSFGNLNSFMQRGTDYSYLDEAGDYSATSSVYGGSIRDRIKIYGYGGDFSG
jgi:antitoxin component HigA of HigAB toxin-antitoxin module